MHGSMCMRTCRTMYSKQHKTKMRRKIEDEQAQSFNGSSFMFSLSLSQRYDIKYYQECFLYNVRLLFIY